MIVNIEYIEDGKLFHLYLAEIKDEPNNHFHFYLTESEAELLGVKVNTVVRNTLNEKVINERTGN